jgi:hypothetical protein
VIRAVESVCQHGGNIKNRHRILCEKRGRVGYVNTSGPPVGLPTGVYMTLRAITSFF